ncbi:MAG TPA: hypothetical protein VI911_04890 [Patescibacteria group bacterium]|nr:hypothetical protein [Patescibacteria group bacterium]
MRKIIKIISLTNAKVVFPAKYTKIRDHDLIAILKDYNKIKYMSEKEREGINIILSQIRDKYNNNFEFIAERDGNAIKFIAID